MLRALEAHCARQATATGVGFAVLEATVSKPLTQLSRGGAPAGGGRGGASGGGRGGGGRGGGEVVGAVAVAAARALDYLGCASLPAASPRARRFAAPRSAAGGAAAGQPLRYGSGRRRAARFCRGRADRRAAWRLERERVTEVSLAGCGCPSIHPFYASFYSYHSNPKNIYAKTERALLLMLCVAFPHFHSVCECIHA